MNTRLRAGARTVKLAVLLILCSVIMLPASALAATPGALRGQPEPSSPPPEEFFLQISPSPLVAELKPGVPTTLELKIRNASTGRETLRIEARDLKSDRLTGEVALSDSDVPAINQWIKFSNPVFSVEPSATYVQKITVSLPKEAGFSYAFAIMINRKDAPKQTAGTRAIKGSVAVFTLLNVDRPGATRSMDIIEFKTDKSFYEYLPAKINMKVKNTGNTFVQPYGNIYLQRGTEDKEPITTLDVNDKHSFILPDTTRTISAEWSAGFPTRRDGKLVWDWSKVADMRIGRYTAKLIAVYNDGHRDIPVVQTVSFWVMPWKIIGGLLFGFLLVLVGVISIVINIKNLVKKGRKRRGKSTKASSEKSDKTKATSEDVDKDTA